MVPESLIGRLTGALCSLSGILVVAIPAPVLEKNFKNKDDIDELPTAEEIAKEKAKYDIGWKNLTLEWRLFAQSMLLLKK